jgi:hypothetical protein
VRYTRNRSYPVEQRHVDEAGVTLHGGADGTKPTLADAVDADVQTVANRVTGHDSALADLAADIAALQAFQNALPKLAIQTGKIAVSFSNQSLYTLAVTFPQAFGTAPTMMCTIESGSGVTGRWDVRPFNITTTGFTLFCFPNDAGTTQTWASVPVSWTALTIG